MPDCPGCGAAGYIAKQGLPWWTCPNDDCSVAGFLNDDAPATEDPRNPQAGLSAF
jgi:hypothetical protein